MHIVKPIEFSHYITIINHDVSRGSGLCKIHLVAAVPCHEAQLVASSWFAASGGGSKLTGAKKKPNSPHLTRLTPNQRNAHK